MIIAATSTPTDGVTIDATLLAFIPIVTVVLTILAGLVGAAIQSRREHVRWVRERRYDAFVDVGAQINRMISAEMGQAAARSGLVADGEDLLVVVQREVLLELPRAIAPLRVLGPKSVERAAERAMTLVQEGGSEEELDAAHSALTRTMRKSLRVRG